MWLSIYYVSLTTKLFNINDTTLDFASQQTMYTSTQAESIQYQYLHLRLKMWILSLCKNLEYNNSFNYRHPCNFKKDEVCNEIPQSNG